MDRRGIKAKVLGGFLSSKRLLRDNIWMIKATITGRKTIGIVASLMSGIGKELMFDLCIDFL